MRNILTSILFFFVLTTTTYAGNCYKVMIQEPNPFLGNGGEIVVFSDGSIWKNMSYSYLYLYAYFPNVTVCPSEGKMILNDKIFSVVRIR